MDRYSGFLAIVVGLVASVTCTNPVSADWPQFRGSNSAGHGEGAIPINFGPGTNELWSVPVAPGHSSPCVVKDVLIITTFDKDATQLKVVALNKTDGSERWTYRIDVPLFEKGHPSFNPASSSPTSDGEQIVAYFGSYGLVCLNMDGIKQWEIKMPVTKSYAGNATSPVIMDDQVILYRGNHVDHFLLAVDKATGKERWRVDQDEPFESELACTACPIRAGDKLIVHSARSVQAFDLKSGEQIWVTKCATTATSTPVIANGHVIVAAWNKLGEPALRPDFPTFDQLVEKHDRDGDNTISHDEYPRIWIFHRPDGAEAPQNGAPMGFRRTDHNKDGKLTADEWSKTLKGIEKFRAGYQNHGLLAIPINSQGTLGPDSVTTLETSAIPEVPSPLFHDGVVYMIKNGGVLTCIDFENQERICRTRTRGNGTHYASPIIADGKIVCTAGDGTISVLSLEQKPRILAVNKMGDSTYATPAVSDGVLYIRTHSKIYAFAAKDGQ